MAIAAKPSVPQLRRGLGCQPLHKPAEAQCPLLEIRRVGVSHELEYTRSYEWNHTGKAAAYLEAAFGVKRMGADFSADLEVEAKAFKAAADSFKQWAILTNVKNDSEYRDKMQGESFLPQDLGKGKDYKVDHLY